MTDTKSLLEKFQAVRVQRPAEIAMQQIHELIATGVLQPGDRLPPERELAERLAVGRGHVREAIRTLALYGILETAPQSGTTVARVGIQALEGMIAKVLMLAPDDWRALFEVRELLELGAADWAARRATDAQKAQLAESAAAFQRESDAGSDGLEQDLLFHLQLADAAANPVLRFLIGLIMPDILAQSRERHTCRDSRPAEAVSEHEAILQAVVDGDPALAVETMKEHINSARRRGENASG